MADGVMTMTENNEPSLPSNVNIVILVVQRLNNYDDVDIYASRLRCNSVLNCALSLSLQVCVALRNGVQPNL